MYVHPKLTLVPRRVLYFDYIHLMSSISSLEMLLNTNVGVAIGVGTIMDVHTLKNDACTYWYFFGPTSTTNMHQIWKLSTWLGEPQFM